MWISRDQIYSYANASNRWSQEGSYDACSPESFNIVQNGYEQQDVQVAYSEGYEFYTYYQGTDGLTPKLTIKDTNTQSYIVYDETIVGFSGAATTRLKLSIYQGDPHIFFLDASNQLKSCRFYFQRFIEEGAAFNAAASFNVQTIPGAVLKNNGTDGNGLYDLANVGKDLLVFYHDNTKDYIAANVLSLEAWATQIDPFATPSVKPKYAIDCNVSDDGLIGVTAADNTHKVKFGICSAAGNTLAALATIEDVSTITGATSVANVTSVTTDGSVYDIF